MLEKINKICNNSVIRHHKSFKNVGFTLAEVLITIGIIGVVSALTIPSLVQKYNDRVTINKLKKIYSIYCQAYQRAITDNGGVL